MPGRAFSFSNFNVQLYFYLAAIVGPVDLGSPALLPN